MKTQKGNSTRFVHKFTRAAFKLCSSFRRTNCAHFLRKTRNALMISIWRFSCQWERMDFWIKFRLIFLLPLRKLYFNFFPEAIWQAKLKHSEQVAACNPWVFFLPAYERVIYVYLFIHDWWRQLSVITLHRGKSFNIDSVAYYSSRLLSQNFSFLQFSF